MQTKPIRSSACEMPPPGVRSNTIPYVIWTEWFCSTNLYFCVKIWGLNKNLKFSATFINYVLYFILLYYVNYYVLLFFLF